MRPALAALAAALVLCASPAGAKQQLSLGTAYMCEQVAESGPENRAVVFSSSAGKIYCFSFFDEVPAKTAVYHAWYHGEHLVARRKLFVEPPSWQGYTSMQLRETDKGPWHVEIIGPENRVLETVRFSVTD